MADLSDPTAVHAARGTGAGAARRESTGWCTWWAATGAATASPSNTDEDWRFLSAALIDTLRHVTLSFHDDLVRSTAGRAVIVSARAAAAAHGGFGELREPPRLPRRPGCWRSPTPSGPAAPGSAATILVIKALVDERMRAQAPHRKFPGFTDVDDLAARIVGLWSMDVQACNGARIALDT